MRLAVLVFFIFLLPLSVESAEVIRVIDGDTMKLDDGRRVRLYGIDCPEGRQETGDEATAFVRRMAEGEFFIIQRWGKIVMAVPWPLCIFRTGAVSRKRF